MPQSPEYIVVHPDKGVQQELMAEMTVPEHIAAQTPEAVQRYLLNKLTLTVPRVRSGRFAPEEIDAIANAVTQLGLQPSEAVVSVGPARDGMIYPERRRRGAWEKAVERTLQKKAVLDATSTEDPAPDTVSTEASLPVLDSQSKAVATRLANAYEKTTGKRPNVGKLTLTVERDAQRHIQSLARPDLVDAVAGKLIGKPIVEQAAKGNGFFRRLQSLLLSAREYGQRYENVSGFHTPQTFAQAIWPVLLKSFPFFGDLYDGVQQAVEIAPTKDIYGTKHYDILNKILGIAAGFIPVPFVTSDTLAYLRNVVERSVEREVARQDTRWIEMVETRRSEQRIGRDLQELAK